MEWKTQKNPHCPRCSRRGGVCKLENAHTLTSAKFAAVPVLDLEISDEGWAGSVGRDYENIIVEPFNPTDIGFDPADEDAPALYYCTECRGTFSEGQLGEAQAGR